MRVLVHNNQQFSLKSSEKYAIGNIQICEFDNVFAMCDKEIKNEMKKWMNELKEIKNDFDI